MLDRTSGQGDALPHGRSDALADTRGGTGRTHRRMWSLACYAGLAGLLMACSDAPDWRGVQPEGWRLTASMPCRPSQHSRPLTLVGREMHWALWTCETAGHRYALGSGDVGDPSAVLLVLRALPASAALNLGAKVDVLGPAAVPGMTPGADAVRYSILGKTPQGVAHRVQGVVFAHGTRVYQAMVMGPEASDVLAQPLFEALKVQAP